MYALNLHDRVPQDDVAGVAPVDQFKWINATLADFALMDERRGLPQPRGERALCEAGRLPPFAEQAAEAAVLVGVLGSCTHCGSKLA